MVGLLIHWANSMMASVMLKIWPFFVKQVLFCRLTVEQRAVYKEYIASAEVENIMTGRLLVFPGLIKLRKICNHPDLTTGELRTKYTPGKTTDKEEEYGYYKRSGKLVVCKVGVLFALLPNLFAIFKRVGSHFWMRSACGCVCCFIFSWHVGTLECSI